MECYSGEVMNAYRDTVAAQAADVAEYREKMIADGAKWYSVTCEDRHGETFVLDTLAFTHEEARASAMECSFVVSVVDSMTEEELEAQ